MSDPALSYRVDLPAFQGPLDLLLHLIRSEEMDIHDIPIRELVEQYRDYLERMEEANLTIAGEYMYMLAVLLVIKARMLLPDTPAEEPEDPRTELVQQILAYEVVKRAADELARLNTLHGTMVGRTSRETVLSLDDVSLNDIAEAFTDVLSRIRARAPANFIPRDRPSVRATMRRIIMRLPKNGRPVSIVRLLEGLRNRMEVITCFIGILELVRTGSVAVLQEQTGGDLFLRRKKRDIDLDILEEEYA